MYVYIYIYDMRVSLKLGVPFFGAPKNKDHNILGSMLGQTYIYIYIYICNTRREDVIHWERTTNSAARLVHAGPPAAASLPMIPEARLRVTKGLSK